MRSIFELLAARAAQGGGTSGSGGGGISLDSAKVGQLISVKAVDANGKPTEWEAVDNPLASVTIMAERDYDNDVIEAYGSQIPIFELVNYPKEGENYTINWNGVEYICTAQVIYRDGLALLGMGNSAVVGGRNSGEPFAIVLAPNETVAQAAGMHGAIIPVGNVTSLKVGIKSGDIFDSTPIVYFTDFTTDNYYLYKTPDVSRDDNKVTVDELKIHMINNRRIVVKSPVSDSSPIRRYEACGVMVTETFGCVQLGEDTFIYTAGNNG